MSPIAAQPGSLPPRPGAPSESVATADVWDTYKASHDAAARERLILHYSPLVKFVAVRVAAGLPSSVEETDLLSYGVLGRRLRDPPHHHRRRRWQPVGRRRGRRDQADPRDCHQPDERTETPRAHALLLRGHEARRHRRGPGRHREPGVPDPCPGDQP